MSKIFDNIETKFEDGLKAILTNAGVVVSLFESKPLAASLKKKGGRK